MKIAIAILNWNGKNWLEKFLSSILKYSEEANVYLIDNCSTDDSVSFVKNHFNSVHIIENKSNLGFAGGYNEGIKSIDSDIICLLNNDVEVTPNWLQPIIDLFEKNPQISVIQPKILDFQRKEYFEYSGAAGGLIDHLGYPYCRGRIFRKIEKDRGQYNDIKEIFWACGCCFFIRKEDFQEIGGFDESFFAHQEEIDLCWRLINQGKKIMYCGFSTIYHVGGGSLNHDDAKKTFLNFRNNLLMLLKNLPKNKIISIIFLRLCLDGISGIYLGLKKGFSHTLAIIKAHFSFYRIIAKTLKKRKQPYIKIYYQSKWVILKSFLNSNKKG